MKNKKRLDGLLLDRKLVETRSKAQALILAGQVVVEFPPNHTQPTPSEIKPGSLFPETVNIRIKESCPYVSRGGEKLAFALKHWNISVEGKIVLDVGASTGGFSDCLLQNGAKFIYAMDVGHGQLHPKIRNDARVQVYEKTHILKWVPKWKKNGVPNFVTIDVSFISLVPVLKSVVEILGAQRYSVLALIKPQFEVGQKFLKKGIVKTLQARAQSVDKIV